MSLEDTQNRLEKLQSLKNAVEKERVSRFLGYLLKQILKKIISEPKKEYQDSISVKEGDFISTKLIGTQETLNGNIEINDLKKKLASSCSVYKLIKKECKIISKKPDTEITLKASLLLLLLKLKIKEGKAIDKSKILERLKKLLAEKLTQKIYLVFLVDEKKELMKIKNELNQILGQ